jgi:2-oxoglutarate dehydrogenase E2 component (dihydrolipoamide succinyltransferase)
LTAGRARPDNPDAVGNTGSGEKELMRIEIKVPELGDSGAEEAAVSFWYFDQGEKIKEGEDLVELVTDKAAFNLPAPAAGVLAEVKSAEGDSVKVGEVIGLIETEE